MEILDDYQEAATAVSSGTGCAAQSVVSPPEHRVVAEHAAAANIASIAAAAASMVQHHHHHNRRSSPADSPLSHQDEELSDPDRQDEESGEELPQQPMQGTNHSSHDNTPTPTPLSHLNSLMGSTIPHNFTKIKTEHNDLDLLSNKSGLEALQAAMSGGGFSLPFPFSNPGAFLNPAASQQSQLSSHQQQTTHQQQSHTGNNGTSAMPTSSASSHSSESSQGSGRNNGLELGPEARRDSQSSSQQQQQNNSWSFEEQFKQLYEINDDPKRKEFLDDLFSFMQKRGTPINRLPIMAKSVLDLYELYNLVIARGGLVDVINKKLWQEIIKGLHLPSSITSAAFTLRTQYMKYLYPYECEKKHLSTPDELQAAIDGNRREGRRSNYGAYGGPELHHSHHQGRSPHQASSLASLHAQMSPLSLVTAVQQAAAATGQHQVGPHQALVNGSAAHTPLPLHPHHPSQGALGQLPNAGIAPDLELRMAEYMKHLQREMGRRAAGSPPGLLNHVAAAQAQTQHHQQQQHLHNRQSSASPPGGAGTRSPPSRDAALFEMSRLTLWNMYNNNLHSGLAAAGYPQSLSPRPASPHGQPASPEPQKEALDLGLRSSPTSSSPAGHSPPSSGSISIKREADRNSPAHTTPSKRLCLDEDSHADNHVPSLPGTHIKISNRGDGRDNSLVVSMELNGVMYQGVLFAQTDGRSNLAINNNESKASSRNVIS